MNKIISSLVSCIYLVSASNAMEKLYNASDLSDVNNNINLQCDNIYNDLNNYQNDNIGNNLNNHPKIHKHKPKYKYSHKKKKKSNNNSMKHFDINSDISKNATKFQEILTNDIHSKKFKILGDIHKKIMNNDMMML